MGFSYLDGKEWAEVTREERFFCQRLYGLLACDKEMKILSLIRNHKGRAPPRAENWESAFEVCFYRDFSQHWNTKNRNSPKRTFDLCLFSEEAIIIIEAKAQQVFDVGQLDSFRTDCDLVRREVSKHTCTHEPEVWIIGLASSGYKPTEVVKNSFDGPLLTWDQLSKLYGDDKVLKRADCVYDPNQLNTWGKNNERYMRGEDLMEAHGRGMKLYVGRRGGLKGSAFLGDLQDGSWRTRKYETSSKQVCLNDNWFLLSEFAEAVSKV